MRPNAAGLCLATLACLAACDVPTAAPKFTTEWNVPAKNTTISVNTFLPTGVTATNDNAAFQATVSPASTSIVRTLGQDCTSCVNGQTAPKPAFVGGGTSSLNVPSGVSSATLVRDTLTVTITNGFNFDPIRPSASGARGYLVIRIASGSATIGRDSLDGATLAIAAGGTMTRKIPLTGTVAGANGLQISTTLNSPAGDAVAINNSQPFTVSGATGPLFLSAASVSLANQQVSSPGSDLDLGSIDKTITDHLESGKLLLTLNNPFSATGNLVATFSGGSSIITKPLTLSGGTSTPSIELTKTDLQALFGHKITITFTGSVNGSNVAVTPGQTVAVASRLQVGIKTGGN